MVFFPNCKINLGLSILRKREDGYHDLDTVFYPLSLKDILEITPAETPDFTALGLPIPGDAASNLCVKAFELLKNDFPHLPPIHIHLYKNIPMGAGLGGGSSDGAAMLLLMNKRFQLGLSTGALQDYAGRLGSDCPFFILNQPCLGQGRGERLRPLPLDLSGYSFALVHPGIHINTGWAFSQCNPSDRRRSVEDIVSQPMETWKGELVNDFEGPIMREYPVLRSVRDSLYGQGAIYASMTGSGSSFFGIFPKGALPAPAFAGDLRVSFLA